MILESEIKAGNLPLNFEGTPLEVFQAIRLRLYGYINAKRVLMGQYRSFFEPAYNVGPWYNRSYWNFWDDIRFQYVPEVRRIDGPTPNVYATFEANPTKNRFQYLPDKDGDLLFVRDIYVPRATKIVRTHKGNWGEIDWGLSSDFFHRLHTNMTFYMKRSIEGQRITVYIQNAGTAFKVTWPGHIQWPDGVAPGQPLSNAGQVRMNEYRFVNINGVIFGEVMSSNANANPSNTIFIGGEDDDEDHDVATPVGITPRKNIK